LDKVEVDIKTGAVVVTGEQLDDQHIVAVLAKLGYPATIAD
jgi:copper chaperone CopZ